MKHFILGLTGAVMAIMVATPASAQAVCGDRNEIVARLESGYQEKSSAMGVSTNGGLVELYTSEKGTWTLMLTQPNGTSCLIAAGNNWESLSDPKSASQVF